MAETKLTTVKILKNVYSKFKRLSFESDITLQKLVNRAVDKYVEDEDFRKELKSKTIEPLDVLYIDGLHSLEGCNSDFDVYSPYLKKGGFLLVDNIDRLAMQQSVKSHILGPDNNQYENLGVWKVMADETTWIGRKW